MFKKRIIITLIDKYIFKQFISSYVGSLSLFYIIFLIIKLSEGLPSMLKYPERLTALEKIYYFLFEFPVMGIYFIPIAALLSIVFILTKLNNQNESIAIYTSGTSILRITLPIFIFALLTSIFYTLTEDSIVYKYHLKHRDLHNRLHNRLPPDKWNRYNLSLFGSENKIYFVNKYSSRLKTLYNTQILYLTEDDKNIKKIISFEKAIFIQGTIWKATNLIERTWENYKIKQINELGNTSIDLKEGNFHFSRPKENNSHLSTKEIKKFIELKKITGGNTLGDLADVYFRYATYFIFVFILLLGVPISSVARNANFVISLLIVLIIVIFYFIIGYIFNSLGREGIIPPMLSGWMANLLSFFIGLYYWRSKRLI